MGFLDRFRRKSAGKTSIPDDSNLHTSAELKSLWNSAMDELVQWEQTRVGVEMVIEPETFVNRISVVLVGFDGEWIRRTIGTTSNARKLAQKLSIPISLAAESGYPPRMRAYEEMRIKKEKEEYRQSLRRKLAQDDT